MKCYVGKNRDTKHEGGKLLLPEVATTTRAGYRCPSPAQTCAVLGWAAGAGVRLGGRVGGIYVPEEENM